MVISKLKQIDSEDGSAYDTEQEPKPRSDDYFNAEDSFVTAQSLASRKAKFYKELDRKIAALNLNNQHTITDEGFSEIYNFMKSIKDIPAETRISIMKTYPNKIHINGSRSTTCSALTHKMYWSSRRQPVQHWTHVKKMPSLASSLMLYGKSAKFRVVITIPNQRHFTRVNVQSMEK
jgi:hypothetical protein